MKISLITYLVFAVLTLVQFRQEPKRTEAFKVHLKDSLLHQVNLVYSEDSLPDQYHCYVRSPVCDDGLCKLVAIHIYWDLLGNFQHFEIPEGRPLTKFDHLEFTEDDYLKLRDILKDKNSILGQYQVEELIDESTQLVSDSVDATTGATKETVKKAVVSGAVYSTFTLWHAVNGKISHKIDSFTRHLVDTTLIKRFLESENHHYHHFALDNIATDKMDQYQNELFQVLKYGNIFVAKKLIDKLSGSYLNKSLWQAGLTGVFDSLIYQKQQFILHALAKKELHTDALYNMTANLSAKSEAQLKTILSLVESNQAQIDNSVVENLAKLLDNQNPAFAELGLKTLENIKETNRLAKNTLKNYDKQND